VNNSFDPQHNVSGRRYGYLFPEFLLGSAPLGVQRLNAALARFVGTHYFHNFTDKLRPSDPSAQRLIRECMAVEPLDLVPGHARVIRATFVGQSFLLHQIRRMIGFAIEVTRRGLDPVAAVDDALNRSIVIYNQCTAPAEGLFLDASLFDTFNENARVKQKREGPQQRPIDFLNDATLCAQREAFIATVIMPQMFPADGSGNDVFQRWLVERQAVAVFPVQRVASAAHNEQGDLEHFLRHVSDARYKRWMAEDRTRRS